MSSKRGENIDTKDKTTKKREHWREYPETQITAGHWPDRAGPPARPARCFYHKRMSCKD